jgi:acetyltransferase-like isoleucine patch superfamily enzyme
MTENDKFKKSFGQITNFQDNPYHPLVWISGSPTIGQGVFIGAFSEINAKDANLIIGEHCDIASFVAINCADSHLRCIGLSDGITRNDITIEEHVFIGSHSVVKGGAHIGHHCVIGAGTIVEPRYIPPYSLVIGNPMIVKEGYYLNYEK